MSNNITDESVKNYLLGSEIEDKQIIEERIFSDDEFFEHFLAIEDELIQEYVDGELAESEIKAFENNFLVSAERLEKLKFARSFASNFNDDKIIDSLCEYSNVCIKVHLFQYNYFYT